MLRSKLATRNPGATPWFILVLAVALLTSIFCGNAFRFYPRFIDKVYDETSDQGGPAFHPHRIRPDVEGSSSLAS